MKEKNIYIGIIITINILYLLTFLGITYINETYIETFNFLIRFFVSIILIINFNPYNKHKMTELDKTLIFSTASFLLLNLLVTEGYLEYIETNQHVQTLKNKIMNESI